MLVNIFLCNGGAIEWEHLESPYKSGTGAVRPAPGLSLLHKVKYEHVYVTSFSKVRVDLAAEVCTEPSIIMIIIRCLAT